MREQKIRERGKVSEARKRERAKAEREIENKDR